MPDSLNRLESLYRDRSQCSNRNCMLSIHQRQKLDPTDDRDFYQQPRFVTHVDPAFIDRLTHLYRERIPPQSRVFDLISSWVSHLPPDREYAEVIGHGLNPEELAKNPRLDRYFVQNLNREPKLPLADASVDAVLNTVSVQYLEFPEAIFTEIGRILAPGGIAIVSFSNRMFYQKAISVWRDGTEESRVKLVESYFRAVPGFSQPESIVHRANVPEILRLMGLGGGDPFYATIATKE
jgi:SAM-dependent methyltransferase